MRLATGSCSICLYHFVANLLTKHPHKIYANQPTFMEDMIKSILVPFFMTHSVYIYIYI
jgi:hypothetical protein